MAIFGWPSGWDPFASMRFMQRELDRLFSRSAYGQGQRVGGGVYPPVNVLNGPDNLVVQFEVPGVRREDMDISLTGETLTIKGTKPPSADESKVRYERRERGSGDFSRNIVLPDRVDPDQVEAKLAGGILTIRLPKSQSARPKQIAVK